jgi:type IV secretory pathway VirB2 component (pilin)
VKKSITKKYFLLLGCIFSAFFIFAGYALADNACVVTSAQFYPSGNQPDGWYKAVRLATLKDKLVHLLINTQNCAGKRISVSVRGPASLQSPEIDELNNASLLVGADGSLDIAAMPGEEYCQQTPGSSNDCSYSIYVNKTANGATDNYYTYDKPSGVLKYDCDGACFDNWIVAGLDDYLNGQQVSQSQTNNLQANGQYNLLAPLPDATQPGGLLKTFNIGSNNSFSDYLKLIFRLLIGIAGILSVIMIVIGGIEYMSTDAVSGKEAGLDRLNQAVLGLMIALGAWLLLNSINPQILSLRFNQDYSQQNIPIIEEQDTPQSPVGGTYCGGKYKAGADWATASGYAPSALPAGVAVNKGECIHVGDINCTSLRGLKTDYINAIRTNCPACQLVITGGTECWLHNQSITSHLPGSPTIDLSVTASLNKYITGSEAFPSGGRYLKDGMSFLAEQPGQTSATTGKHWHVGQ